jgi:hypothetical protein
MKPSICQNCEKEAVMFEGDNTGYCYEHAMEHAQEEWEREQEEEATGITQLDITLRAKEKRISFFKAKEELFKEKGLEL